MGYFLGRELTPGLHHRCLVVLGAQASSNERQQKQH